MKKSLTILFIVSFINTHIYSQCSGSIAIFPYTEGFEINNGNWISGGTGNDWAWGTPTKPVISSAGSGNKCWVIGGLSGNSYTNAEASWIQSPCFDFTSLQYPYIECKLFWEMEQQFDGASFQFSLDNGTTWTNVGSINDAKNCLNENWFNYSPITYLAPLATVREGWSGNSKATTGSCRGGNGSNGWVTVKHTMPYLAGQTGVLFRFIFGAGTICNNYDGFAVDDIFIGEAPPNNAGFTYSCVNSNSVNFTNTSVPCPDKYEWNFDDPSSGTNNTSAIANPTHVFSAPGIYTVTLTVSGSGNAPSTYTKNITIAEASVMMASAVDCITNTGGSLLASADPVGATLVLTWNTSPVQTGLFATNLSEGIYTLTVSGTDVCPITATGKAEKDLSCIGIYFPSAFTPDGNGRNDGFGPLGSLPSLTNYRMLIYNRWGQQVFTSTNPYVKWNGMVNGTATNGNVFVWFAEFSISGKPVVLKKGTVVLIR